MSSQGYLNLVINIEPLRVMINLVSFQGHSAHEPEGLVEVLEDELLVDGVPVVHHGPAFQHNIEHSQIILVHYEKGYTFPFYQKLLPV